MPKRKLLQIGNITSRMADRLEPELDIIEYFKSQNKEKLILENAKDIVCVLTDGHWGVPDNLIERLTGLEIEKLEEELREEYKLNYNLAEIQMQKKYFKWEDFQVERDLSDVEAERKAIEEAKRLAKTRRHRAQGELRIRLALRTSQVRAENQTSSPGEELPDRGQSGLNAGVVGDLSVLQGNVEIHPHQDLTVFHLEITNTELAHDVARAEAPAKVNRSGRYPASRPIASAARQE